MYSVAFIFEPNSYDEVFLELDAAVEKYAQSLDGFIGKESWQTADGRRRNSTYYWKNKASIKQFSAYERHIEAKRQYQKWYKGYHIVVSKVEHSYGDGFFQHFTA